jgi:hypothetical protein
MGATQARLLKRLGEGSRIVTDDATFWAFSFVANMVLDSVWCRPVHPARNRCIAMPASLVRVEMALSGTTVTVFNYSDPDNRGRTMEAWGSFDKFTIETLTSVKLRKLLALYGIRVLVLTSSETRKRLVITVSGAWVDKEWNIMKALEKHVDDNKKFYQ